MYKAGTDPLSPENPVILGVGALENTGVQGVSKTVATTRFPQNGSISESVGSMRFAVNMKGNNRPKIYDRSALKELISVMRERLKRFKGHKEVLELGFMEGWDTLLHKIIYTRNFTEVFPFDRGDKLYGLDVYRNFKAKRFGCPSCITPDKEYLEIIDGPFSGFKTTTTSYINSFLCGQSL